MLGEEGVYSPTHKVMRKCRPRLIPEVSAKPCTSALHPRQNVQSRSLAVKTSTRLSSPLPPIPRFPPI